MQPDSNGLRLFLRELNEPCAQKVLLKKLQQGERVILSVKGKSFPLMIIDKKGYSLFVDVSPELYNLPNEDEFLGLANQIRKITNKAPLPTGARWKMR